MASWQAFLGNKNGLCIAKRLNMKKLGLGIILLGAIMPLASFGLFGTSVKKAMDAQVVGRMALRIGKQATTDPSVVATDALCQIAIDSELKIKSVTQEAEGQKIAYKPRYHFPVSYSILDAQDKVLFSEPPAFSSKSGAFTVTRHESLNSTGGTTAIEQSFEKFQVPSPGKIRVLIKVDADKDYQAVPKKLELKVYDHVLRHAGPVISGSMMCCASPVVIVVGVAIFLAGLLQRRQ